MKAITIHASLVLAALVAVEAALPAFAYDGQAIYRAQVLGEHGVMPAPSATVSAPAERKLTPGSYARYFMYLGRSQEQAISEARRIGEEPAWTTEPVAPTRHVDGREVYERHMGRLPRLELPSSTGVAQNESPPRR